MYMFVHTYVYLPHPTNPLHMIPLKEFVKGPAQYETHVSHRDGSFIATCRKKMFFLGERSTFICDGLACHKIATLNVFRGVSICIQYPQERFHRARSPERRHVGAEDADQLLQGRHSDKNVCGRFCANSLRGVNIQRTKEN